MMRTLFLNRTTFATAARCCVLVALFLLVPVESSRATIWSCTMPNCPKGCGESGGDGGILSRTFNPNAFAKTATGVDFSLTRDDFLRLYAIGREIHIYLSPTEGSYAMDIGFPDLDNPQTWEMPDIPFEGPAVWTITDPADTPHASLFPEATHVLVTMNDQLIEGTVYLYLNFSETALIAMGEVVEGSSGAPIETFTYNVPVTPFPMNETLGIHTEADITNLSSWDGPPAIRLRDAEMHGFGTFASNLQETVKAGVFFDDVVFSNLNAVDPYDPEEIIDYETYYSIFGEDGSWFSFYVDDPPEGDSTAIVGDVYAHFVEYWRVMDPTTTAIEAEMPREAATWSVYPNPATDVIRFNEPMTVSLYDVLGREVGTGTSVQHLDVSQLTAGLYLVRSDTGESKALIIQ